MISSIIANNQSLVLNRPKSALNASASSGENTITIYSINNFAVNEVLLIGDFGDEGSEIIKTHAATAPAGNTVTLASNLVKAHPKDAPVYVIAYDQIEVSHADTLTGSKTILSTFNIDAEVADTVYRDVTTSSGYYFVRYKNSITSVYSSYADGVPYTGYAINTVGYLIYNVMASLNKEFSDTLTHDILIKRINAGLSFIRGKLKRWSNHQEFNYVVDQINRGEYKFALPSTYYDKNSNKSCLAVRIGSSEALTYKDKVEFNTLMEDVDHTTVATEGAVGATSLALANTSDLASSGTIDVFISNTKYTIAYTTNTTSTNTLSGIATSGSSSIQVTLPVGTDVWYNESEGTPYYFSIWDGYLYINELVDSTDAGKNIYMDFYTDIVQVDSDADVLSPVRYDMLEYWLRWEIRNITENNGKRDLQDGDYIMFLTTLADAVRRESSGQKFKLKPKVSGINYGTSNEIDFDKS